MNLESTLNYVTHHSESIIQWLFLTILLLAGAVIARSLFGKKEASASGASSSVGVSNPEIQSFLEKIMEQTAKLESVSLAKMDPETVAQADAQVQALKKELAAREEELQKAKAGGDSKSSDQANGLSARIKELESKLAEYEILEDDIADLSLYKEENARLRADLEKMKSGGAPSPEPAAAPPPEMNTVPPGEDIVAEFAEAVSQQPPPTSSGSDLEIPKTGDPLADFETAVNIEKKMLSENEAPAAAPTPSIKATPAAAAPAPASAPASPAGEPSEGDDLFAEFANPPAQTPDAPEGDGLDTDKMMAEMAALVSVDPGKATSGLEDGIDTEKMALEATNLTNKS